MKDIFLSYARKDSDIAKQVADALLSLGWSVWWDISIPAGRVFDEVIQDAIDQTKCIIVLWSSNSVSSRWVKTEAGEGADRNILVPVTIEKVKIPLAFKRIQSADLVNWNGEVSSAKFMKLVSDISIIIGPPPHKVEAKHRVGHKDKRVEEEKKYHIKAVKLGHEKAVDYQTPNKTKLEQIENETKQQIHKVSDNQSEKFIANTGKDKEHVKPETSEENINVFSELDEYLFGSKTQKELYDLWNSNKINASDRLEATNYLVELGCIDATDEQPATRSGLETALKLWANSGLALKLDFPEIFEKLYSEVTKSDPRKQKAMRLELPIDIWMELGKDKNADARMILAYNENIPVPIMDKLVNDENEGVRLAVASNPKLPEYLLLQLSQDSAVDVRNAVAWEPNTPASVLRELATSEDALVRQAVAGHSKTPVSVLAYCAKDKECTVRAATAENSNATQALLFQLSKDDDDTVRATVARNVNVSINLLEKLASEDNETVLRGVVANMKSSRELLMKIDEKYPINTLWDLINPPQLPALLLEQLISSDDSYNHSLAVSCPNTPPKLLKILANSNDHYVREAVAQNQNLTVDVLELLAKDESVGVRINVAMNRNTPSHVLEELSNEENNSFDYGLAGNPSTPIHVLHNLTHVDENLSVLVENKNSCIEWF